MELPNPRSNIKLLPGETTSGPLARKFGIHYSTVSTLLSNDLSAPKSIRKVGRVNIYLKADLDKYVAKLGGIEEFKAKVNLVSNAYRKARNKGEFEESILSSNQLIEMNRAIQIFLNQPLANGKTWSNY